MKVEALTRQLEEEMERREEEEYFGECCTCQQKVTGAGQACQVHRNPVCGLALFQVKTYLWKFMVIELAFIPGSGLPGKHAPKVGFCGLALFHRDYSQLFIFAH